MTDGFRFLPRVNNMVFQGKSISEVQAFMDGQAEFTKACFLFNAMIQPVPPSFRNAK